MRRERATSGGEIPPTWAHSRRPERSEGPHRRFVRVHFGTSGDEILRSAQDDTPQDEDFGGSSTNVSADVSCAPSIREFAVTDASLLSSARESLAVLRPSEYTAALIQVLQAEAASVRGATVLEIGSGSGVVLAAVAALGAATVCGIDIEQDAVASGLANDMVGAEMRCCSMAMS